LNDDRAAPGEGWISTDCASVRRLHIACQTALSDRVRRVEMVEAHRMSVYLLQLAAWTLFMAALVMVPAGRLDYLAGWILIALFAISGLAMILWLSKSSPELLRERMASPFQREQKPWDRVWLGLFLLAFCGWLALMGWDAARTGFDAVPIWLQIVGVVLIALNGYATWRTFRVNAFAAPVVKIQRDQKPTDTGPYAIVRHPMYAGAIFLFFGVPLLLGSWMGLALAPLFVVAIAWRATREEQALREGLQGYAAYAARVRYRLVPGVW
jgi:protein-S-isoprenylcysteine O-methyltransferase Ste14